MDERVKPRLYLQPFPHPTLASRVVKWVCNLGSRFAIGDTPEEAYQHFLDEVIMNELKHG